MTTYSACAIIAEIPPRGGQEPDTEGGVQVTLSTGIDTESSAMLEESAVAPATTTP